MMMMEDQLPLLAMPTGKSLLDMNEEERESWRANAQKNLDNARTLVYAVNGQRFRESGLPYVEEE